MLLLPVVVGALRTGPTWMHAWLLIAWLLAYLAFQATELWLRSGRKPRYRPPVLAYEGAVAVVGGGLLFAQPQLLHWGVVYGPLLALSLGFAARRADRALVNDLLTTAAASLMVAVASGIPDDGAWLPGATEESLAVAAVVFAYFAGTALYVKTMIRERGNRRYLLASIGYHLVAAAVATWWWLPLGVFFTALTARAVVVPVAFPRTKPLVVGLGEIAASVVLAVLLLLR